MIHEIGRELLARLQANGDPLQVVDGPEPTATAAWGRERIVIEHDADGTDSFGAPRGLHTNAKHRYTATEACKLTIYARSAVSGATVFEHRERAKKLRDDVMVAMDLVAATRRNRWHPGTGRFVTPPDLEGSEKPGGAVYELKFTFEQPVEVRTFAGAARPEGRIGTIMSGSPQLVFEADDRSITRSAGSWVGDGFAAGMSVAITGSESNDVFDTIATITADVITLTTAALVDEGPVSGVTIRAGGFRSSTRVSRANGGVDATPETSCGA